MPNPTRQVPKPITIEEPAPLSLKAQTKCQLTQDPTKRELKVLPTDPEDILRPQDLHEARSRHKTASSTVRRGLILNVMAFAAPEDSFHPHVFRRSPFNISRHRMCILGASNGERRLLLSRPPVPLHDGINTTEPRTLDDQESTATHPTIVFLTKLTTVGIGRRFQHRDVLNSTHESQRPNVRTFRDLRHHAIGTL
jgi:hypothetical protein